MTHDEIIKQLESLLSHCKSMIEKDGGFPIWEKDCEALETAIAALRPCYRERAEKAENIASDLCDDFTDFVTGGVHNAAPYCANCRPECVNQRGWCNGDNRVCRGFLPKAAGVKEE